MTNEVYVVTGATGNIGKELVALLLSKGKKVRAVARVSDRLNALTKKGAEPAAGSLDDTAFLTKAFAGASTVFAMIPPSYGEADFRAYQNKIGESLAKAITAAGVKSVVNLGRDLNLEVVAEGVENATLAKLLLDASCHYGQGFGYAPALPAQEAEVYLNESLSDGTAPLKQRSA